MSVRLPSDMLDPCLADLAKVLDDLRWAYVTGYGKKGRGLDAERGELLPEPKPELCPARDDEMHDEDWFGPPARCSTCGTPRSPDRVPGPVYALDIGDHECRAAYQRTAKRLAKVEVHAALACDLSDVDPQPILTHPSPGSRIGRLVSCTAGVRWRLATLRDVEVSEAKRRRIRHHLTQIRRLLDSSVRDLGKALSKGKATEATAEKVCRTCEIRPRRDRGRECDTCHTWRVRNKSPRPKKLDEEIARSAQAAKRRREERGEGWGAA